MRNQPATRSLEQIINEVLVKEGHHSNDADDLGGSTTWGITEAVARKNGYTGPMSAMTQAIACDIYFNRYIKAPRFNDIHAISALIGEEVIDTGINMGIGIAAKFLQRWLNAYNNSQAYYKDLIVDGHIGPATLSALEAYLLRRGTEGELIMWRSLNCSQGARYLDISEAREKNEKFIYGWMKNRIS
ncbi:glycoside hydrolase family 108 protein [Photobacterium halotolerans]|uniref:glycoside hydrolase family 108 protein n=1 Tax=Photobacterium halotolerans TaxID=265726 RepID=UPI0003FA47E1|nr:putative peptidoglycan-binding domain-containing protein [Photobacterium halotolerans]